MPFSKDRFLKLAPQSQAKKLADLLKAILTVSGDTGTERTEYNRLVAMLSDRREIAPKASAQQLLELYHHWRTLAGPGPERIIFDRLSMPDRETPRQSPLPWEVHLHNLRSGHNVGSIFRTADCLGFRHVHLGGYTPGPEKKAVASAAMGAETWVPCTRHSTGKEFLELKSGQTTLVALETEPNAPTISDFPWPREGILLLGNEELGVGEELLHHADAVVTIPLWGRKSALNVAIAFALTAWEIRRSLTVGHPPTGEG